MLIEENYVNELNQKKSDYHGELLEYHLNKLFDDFKNETHQIYLKNNINFHIQNSHFEVMLQIWDKMKIEAGL